MQLPPGRSGSTALHSWYDEMLRLKEVLEQQLETVITEDDLRNAIRLKNRERKATLDFFEIGRLKPPLFPAMKSALSWIAIALSRY
jgi:benzoyl-CoA reductase/2-hydroxyglutaryl-CoA dehydratase subunit BcrC/BadD/HgdB